jgi:hypothetical protein
MINAHIILITLKIGVGNSLQEYITKMARKIKRNITVYHYDKFSGEIINKLEVEACCVQGETGFLSFFYDGDFFYIAAGDDGHWWVIHKIHKHWLRETKKVMKEFSENVPKI